MAPSLKNPVNCWDIPLGQSAAKPYWGRFRDYPKGVPSSEGKRRASKDEDIVRSMRQRIGARKGRQGLTPLVEHFCIWDLYPDDTWALTNLDKTKASATYHEW